MRVIKSLVLLFLATLVVSCNEETEVFTGDVYVTLKAKGGNSFVEGEATTLNYDVVLSKSFHKDIKLVFDLEKLTEYPNLVNFKKEVVIPKNKTMGSLKFTGVKKDILDNILTENKNFKILLSSSEGITNKIILDKDYKILIKKGQTIEGLTQSQKDLLKGYKKKGIDLTKWIGEIPVKVKVATKAIEGFKAFTGGDKEYSGTTYITLSEKATVDKPILKMVKNAFGLNDYLQWVFRGETLDNEYWNNPGMPSPTAIMKAIGEERMTKWKNNEYTFNVMVDDIEVNTDGTITFVRENGTYDNYTDFLKKESERERNLSAVDFQYEFPLWDELVKLTESDATLKDHIAQGGSLHPNNYIGVSTILTNDWEGSNWVAPTGSYDSKEMKFAFTSDHTNSEDYDKIEVTFTPKK